MTYETRLLRLAAESEGLGKLVLLSRIQHVLMCFPFSADLGIVPIDTGVRSQGWAASGSTQSRSINRRILAEPAVVLGGLAVPSILGRNGQGLSGTGVRPHADVALRFDYFFRFNCEVQLVSLLALVACPPSAAEHPSMWRVIP